jgi:TetR/AcrR family transcriptional regulator, cholesterol catabolism regulator
MSQVTNTKKASRAGATALPLERRAHLVRLAGELFAEKGFRATTVREIADAAGILSGSLYHHFDSKESIGDAILRGFFDDVLAGYREAVRDTDDPRAAIEQIVRSSTATLGRHRAALTMLQNDWSYFGAQPRFAYLREAMKEIEQIWVDQLERGRRTGQFRADLDARLIYRLLRDILWIPTSWRQSRSAGWRTEQIVDGLLRLLFDGITAHPPEPPKRAPRRSAPRKDATAKRVTTAAKG